jgi:EAL domain-containing protein (putative c-di-GMP-specific phosphodiesterase class I)
VETDKQVEFLTKAGCDMFQGYYFSKPVPVEEFESKYFAEEEKTAVTG